MPTLAIVIMDETGRKHAVATGCVFAAVCGIEQIQSNMH